MSKKKTGAEMILDMLKQYTEAHPETVKKIDETIDEIAPCIRCEAHYCSDCPNWRDEFAEDYEEEDEEGYYEYPECEAHDGDCTECSCWNSDEDYCELDEEGKEEDEIDDCWNDDDDWDKLDDHCRGLKEKENQQLEDLSKLVKSVGAVLGGNTGVLIFDKSNKKDMEKLAAIFADYAKQL